MELRIIKTTKEYLEFIKKLYKNNKFYKDNKSDVINMLCSKKSSFYKNSFQEMVKVVSDGQTKCQTILIRHKNLPKILMLAFFEAEKNSEKEVKLLIDYAKDKAKRADCKKLFVSINGHCNYGLGTLTNNFNIFPSFGEAYNYDYYKDFFEKNFKIHYFHNYKNHLSICTNKLSKVDKKLEDKDIKLEYYDAFNTNFYEAVKIYTDLNNNIFQNHSYYYKREYEEDKELFSSMKPLFLNKNLIIAYKKEQPIGFLLWYPDFNEIVSKQKKLNLLSLIKYKLFNNKPKQILLTEIGVLPEYEKTGLIILLFSKLHNYLYNYYDKNTVVCSGWIYDENTKSKNLVKKKKKKTDKEFCVYELSI